MRERRARCPGETEQDRAAEVRQEAGEDRDSAEVAAGGWAELRPGSEANACARAAVTGSRIRGGFPVSTSPALSAAHG